MLANVPRAVVVDFLHALDVNPADVTEVRMTSGNVEITEIGHKRPWVERKTTLAVIDETGAR